MIYLLDINICIYLIKQKPFSLLSKFNEYEVGEIGVSSITVAELAYGVEKSRRRQQNQQALNQFLAPLVIADFDAGAALAYGHVRTSLELKGTPIGSLDTLIAGHALSLEATLVTNNEREFVRIPKLKVENWLSY